MVEVGGGKTGSIFLLFSVRSVGRKIAPVLTALCTYNMEYLVPSIFSPDS